MAGQPLERQEERGDKGENPLFETLRNKPLSRRNVLKLAALGTLGALGGNLLTPKPAEAAPPQAPDRLLDPDFASKAIEGLRELDIVPDSVERFEEKTQIKGPDGTPIRLHNLSFTSKKVNELLPASARTSGQKYARVSILGLNYVEADILEPILRSTTNTDNTKGEVFNAEKIATGAALAAAAGFALSKDARLAAVSAVAGASLTAVAGTGVIVGFAIKISTDTEANEAFRRSVVAILEGLRQLPVVIRDNLIERKIIPVSVTPDAQPTQPQNNVTVYIDGKLTPPVTILPPIAPESAGTPTAVKTPTLPVPVIRITPTEAPTATATPITPEVEKAQVVFNDGFDGGLRVTGKPDAWFFLHKQGGASDAIDDPTGSNRGKVLKMSVTDHNLPLEADGNYKRRAGPDWYNGNPNTPPLSLIPAPSGISFDQFLSRDLVPQGVRSITIAGIGVPGKSSGKIEFGATIFVSYQDFNGGKRAYLWANSPGAPQIPLDVPINFDTWQNITIKILSDGKIAPFIDGKIALDINRRTISLPSNVSIGLSSADARLYTSTRNVPPTDENDYPLGAFKLLDNFKVINW